MIRLAARQGTPEWLEARRGLVTATDLAAILGVSPWECEADVADRKRGLAPDPVPSVAMRRGTALEPLVLALYAEATGRTVRRQRGMARHDIVPWAAASLDALAGRRVVEAKTTASRTRFADGLPRDVEAQVQWQLGVAGLPVADVAVLAGDEFSVREVAFDREVFADMLRAAEDFRRRLAAGGPFRRDLERIRRDHPDDDGTEAQPDADTAEAVRALLALRGRIEALERDEDVLKARIQAWMGDAASMRGPGWSVTWRRSRDRTEVDWPALGREALSIIGGTEGDALAARHSRVKAGVRPLRVMATED